MQSQGFYQISDLLNQQGQTEKLYLEFLRVPAISAGVYVLQAGATDPQKPHLQDEMYYVVSGRARMQAGAEDREVGSGSVIFVAADVPHRFCDIKEDLTVLVFFAPAENENP